MTLSESAENRDAQIEAMLADWFGTEPADADAMRKTMKRWFVSTPEQDRDFERRFSALATAAAEGLLDELAASARGRLALIILLDQFPRSLHRGTPEAFAQDRRALELCIGGMRLGHLDALKPIEQVFFCMPLQHAEALETQSLSVTTFETLAKSEAPAPLAAALKDFADYAVVHRDIVERFGRFPHRNKVLGRESTAEELAFLDSGGPSFGQ